jgi:hypothetical protein
MWAHDWAKKGFGGVSCQWFRADPGKPPNALFVEIRNYRNVVLEGANLDTDGKEI